MIDLILTILLMSLVCCGAHVVINDDILAEYKKNYQMRHGKEVAFHWSLNPFFTCCRCMASVWGGAIYILINQQINFKIIPMFRGAFISMEWNVDRLIIPAIIATAFLNSVFINYYYSKT